MPKFYTPHNVPFKSQMFIMNYILIQTLAVTTIVYMIYLRFDYCNFDETFELI